MTVNEKIKTIEKIAALSLGNVVKYEFLTSENILSEKRLLKKAATIKIFEYSPLGNELKKKLTLENISISF